MVVDGPSAANSRQLSWLHGQTRGLGLRPRGRGDEAGHRKDASFALQGRQGEGFSGHAPGRASNEVCFAQLRAELDPLLPVQGSLTTLQQLCPRPA